LEIFAQYRSFNEAAAKGNRLKKCPKRKDDLKGANKRLGAGQQTRAGRKTEIVKSQEDFANQLNKNGKAQKKGKKKVART